LLQLLAVVAGVVAPTSGFAAPFPGTLAWELRADLPGGVHGAAGGVLGNRLYVSHGFRGANSTLLDVYDIGADTWSSGAPATVSRSALAGGVAGGSSTPSAATAARAPSRSTTRLPARGPPSPA
jgi:hypothetical protein